MTETKAKAVKPTLKKSESIDPEVMKKHQQMINFLRNEISNVEVELKKMKVILVKISMNYTKKKSFLKVIRLKLIKET